MCDCVSPARRYTGYTSMYKRVQECLTCHQSASARKMARGYRVSCCLYPPRREWKFEVTTRPPPTTKNISCGTSEITAWSPDGSPSGLVVCLHGSGVRGLKADKLKTKNHEPVRVSVRPSHHTTGTPATDVTGSSGVSWSIYLRCRGAERRRHRAVHGPRRHHGRCHGRWLGRWLGSTKEPRPHA